MGFEHSLPHCAIMTSLWKNWEFMSNDLILRINVPLCWTVQKFDGWNQEPLIDGGLTSFDAFLELNSQKIKFFCLP